MTHTGLILALSLALFAPAVGAMAQDAEPTPAQLGISATQAEIDLLWGYNAASNAVRNHISELHMQPQSPEREVQLEAANKAADAVDETVHPIVRRLILAGFWRSETRNQRLDDTVWLVVQHIDDDELKTLTLAQTEPLVKKGLFRGEEYGLLYDRIAVDAGKPQRFGSQLHCVDGRYQLYPLEDAAHVVELRKQYGFIETLDEYVAYYKDMTCTVKP